MSEMRLPTSPVICKVPRCVYRDSGHNRSMGGVRICVMHITRQPSVFCATHEADRVRRTVFGLHFKKSPRQITHKYLILNDFLGYKLCPMYRLPEAACVAVCVLK